MNRRSPGSLGPLAPAARRWVALSCALLLLACHTSPTATKPKTTSVKPSVASTAGAASTVVSLLQKPAGAVATLSGTLTLDASYMVASHAGSMLSNNGGSLLAAGGGLISDNGAGLVSDAGAGIVGKTKGALVSDNGGAVVALAAGNIVSDHGGGLVSDHGGQLLSDAGAGIIANNGSALTGKTKYRLMADAAPAFGQTAIAAGMRLQAVDMTTGQALAIGEDAKHQKVYGVYTNLAGAYEIYLPAGGSTNVRLVATVPGHDDPRTRYSAITLPGSASALSFDEDNAAVTRLLRQVMHQKFLNALQVHANELDEDLTDKAADEFLGTAGDLGAAEPLLAGLLKELFNGLRNNPKITKADYPDIAFLLGDVLLAHAGDLSAIDLMESLYDKDDLPLVAGNPLRSGKAIPNMAAIMRAFREKMVGIGAGKTPGEVAALFAQKPYIQRANAFHASAFPDDPAPYYVIEKPTDLVDFMALEYFGLVVGQSYGCSGDACPTATPEPARGVPTPAPCDLATGCFPSGGIATLNPNQGPQMSRYVAIDVGLPAGDICILGAGAETVVASLALQAMDPVLKAQLLCLVANYNQDHAACDPAASAGD